MIHSIFRAPINLYFDVTPIGRILNKFSKDLSTTERDLHWEIGTLLAIVYQTISIFIVAFLVVKWIVLIIPIITYIAYKLYKRTIRSMRETTRIESLTKSPLLSFFSETFNGASTIRTFRL